MVVRQVAGFTEYIFGGHMVISPDDPEFLSQLEEEQPALPQRDWTPCAVTWLPEGMVFYDETEIEDVLTERSYYDPADETRWVDFGQYAKDGFQLAVDTTAAAHKTVQVQGAEAIMYYAGTDGGQDVPKGVYRHVDVVWIQDGLVMHVGTAMLSRDDTLRIAESVAPVDE